MHILSETRQKRKAFARFHPYVDGMAHVEPNRNLSAFFIRIQAIPGALERVLQPFAVNSLVPRNLTVRPGRSDSLFVWVQFSRIDAGHAVNLAARLRNMPCVCGVRVSSDRHSDGYNERCGGDRSYLRQERYFEAERSDVHCR
jgi:hypothetical protein